MNRYLRTFCTVILQRNLKGLGRKEGRRIKKVIGVKRVENASKNTTFLLFALCPKKNVVTHNTYKGKEKKGGLGVGCKGGRGRGCKNGGPTDEMGHP